MAQRVIPCRCPSCKAISPFVTAEESNGEWRFALILSCPKCRAIFSITEVLANRVDQEEEEA